MNHVTLDLSDGVLAITIDRPEAYNSLDKAIRLELKEAFECAQDPEVRAVVLMGGSKAFCTGQDLKEHVADLQAGAGMGKVVEEYNPMVAALTAIDVPIIAAVEGAAAGAGWSLALHCDFRIAGPKASFKAAFPSIGLATDCGMSALLPRMVSDAKARELLFFDKKVLADEALDLGLVTEVVADPVARARELAAQFASGPTMAFKEIKALLRRGTLAAADAEADAQARLAVSADHKEAVAAFLEKRPPRFEGK